MAWDEFISPSFIFPHFSCLSLTVAPQPWRGATRLLATAYGLRAAQHSSLTSQPGAVNREVPGKTTGVCRRSLWPGDLRAARLAGHCTGLQAPGEYRRPLALAPAWLASCCERVSWALTTREHRDALRLHPALAPFQCHMPAHEFPLRFPLGEDPVCCSWSAGL